jgi:hypothetical protein
MQNDSVSLSVGSEQPAWRQHASALAFAAELVGKAYRLPDESSAEFSVFGCESVREPFDYRIYYDNIYGSIRCDCPAGQHGKACKHAGAVLQLLAGLAVVNPHPTTGRLR